MNGPEYHLAGWEEVELLVVEPDQFRGDVGGLHVDPSLPVEGPTCNYHDLMSKLMLIKWLDNGPLRLISKSTHPSASVQGMMQVAL